MPFPQCQSDGWRYRPVHALAAANTDTVAQSWNENRENNQRLCVDRTKKTTVSAGLLQRCVVRCSSQQYSEAAACPEHCGEDRHTVAKKGTCSTTAGTVTLASCSSTDQVQAGHTDIQDPSFINPNVPRPSHQIASNFTSSSFLRHAFTAQTYYQNSLCWSFFLFYCSYSLEFA